MFELIPKRTAPSIIDRQGLEGCKKFFISFKPSLIDSTNILLEQYLQLELSYLFFYYLKLYL